MMDLDDLVQKVDSKESFLVFVKALLEDKKDEETKEKERPSSGYGSGANGWENNTIPDFLGSMGAYGNDSNTITENASWKNFATLLYSGKFYE